MAAEADLPRWHRVCLNTIVRKGMQLDSERLRILPMGSKVWVVEQVERRVRIDRPIQGWCSLKSSNGDTILTPLEKTPEEESSTPTKETNVRRLEESAKQADQNYQQAAANLAKQAVNIGESINPETKQDMMQMVANGELVQLQKQLAALQDQLAENEAQAARHIEECQSAVREALEAKTASDSAKLLAEARMKELNVLKEQFVEMFTKMEGEEVKSKQDPRPVDQGGVLLLHSGDIAVCRFRGQIPESGTDDTYLGVIYDQRVGDTDGRWNNGDGTFGEKNYLEASNLQMYSARFILEDQVKRRLHADQLLDQLSTAMELHVQNQTVIEGPNMEGHAEN